MEVFNRLDAEEERFHEGELRIGGVKHAQGEHHRDARQDEQESRRQSASYAMQQPARIGRKLLRLGPRQQHAEIQRVQELRLGKPLLLFHENAMHEGDLPRRTAKAQEADLHPDAESLAERNGTGDGHIVNGLSRGRFMSSARQYDTLLRHLQPLVRLRGSLEH